MEEPPNHGHRDEARDRHAHRLPRRDPGEGPGHAGRLLQQPLRLEVRARAGDAGVQDGPHGRGREHPAASPSTPPPPEDTQPQPRNYISVESIDAYAQKLEELGGKVLHRFTVTGMGYGVIGLDPEGNSVSLWEQDENCKE